MKLCQLPPEICAVWQSLACEMERQMSVWYESWNYDSVYVSYLLEVYIENFWKMLKQICTKEFKACVSNGLLYISKFKEYIHLFAVLATL